MSDPAQPTDTGTPTAGRNKLVLRLLYLILIALLIGVAIAVMHALTVVQFIIMLVDKGRPNPQIAAVGKSLGDWLSRAVSFQLAETEDKPWPWSPAD